MDDMSSMLAGILNDPAAMEKIKGLAGMLGQNAPAAEPERKKQEPPSDAGLSSLFPADTLQMVMKLAPLLSSVRQEDDTTRFLRALRPLLGEKRRKRLDESIHMVQLMKVLPLLKSQGIF